MIKQFEFVGDNLGEPHQVTLAAIAQTKNTLSRLTAAQTNSQIPVTVKISPTTASLAFAGQQYAIKFDSKPVQQAFIRAHSYLLNIVQAPAGMINQPNLRLLAVGHPLDLPVPEALLTLARKNGIEHTQLMQLAKRPGGYNLSMASIQGSSLKLNTAYEIKLPLSRDIATGNYNVSIVEKDRRLLMRLSPVEANASVRLTPLVGGTAKQGDARLQSNAQQLQAKPEISGQYHALMRRLESIALPPPQPNAASIPTPASGMAFKANKANVNAIDDGLILTTPDKQGQNKPSRAIGQFLATALSKAGSLPSKASASIAPANNLASALLRLLPALTPSTLTSLSDPQRLKRELASVLNTRFNPASWSDPVSGSHMGTVSLLFQLLLGVNSQRQPISPALQQQLQSLQAQLGLSSHLLALLEKANIHDLLGGLINNVSLYQHNSTDTNGSVNWFFSLPYSINHNQQEFEGHFQQGTDSDDERPSQWQLQLKFNLSHGALLIKAKSSPIDKSLDLNFCSDNPILLDKIELLRKPLSNKLAQVGFTPKVLTTELSQIPATLLPGDHYLVKLEV